MNWKEYENQIYEEFQRRYPTVPVTQNAKVVGNISNKKRQIDVLIETQVLDTPVRIIVDAKNRKHPIDVNDVESFISMMLDVGAHRGILVATCGYTETAIARAHNEPNQDIDLDVFSLAELKYFQGEFAIPYHGSSGVMIDAPFGWVVDALKRPYFPACLYQRGYDLDAAGEANEWMYLNFWKKENPHQTLDDYLEIHNKEFLSAKPGTKLTYLPGTARADAQSRIRLAEVPGYPTPEYTGFVEFKDFIFFAVLFTPIDKAKRNLRKLRELMRNAQPIHVLHKESPTQSGSPESPSPLLNSGPAASG